MMNYPRQTKNKVFPHSPYDMYSEYVPIYGYFIDDDEKSDTFGQVLFGQIGEKNLQAEVDSYKDECDLTLIKEQLLNTPSANDWSAIYEDEEVDEFAESEIAASVNTPILGNEDTSKSGTVNIEDQKEA